MFAVQRLQGLGTKAGVPLFQCFVDLQKAYDSVDRTRFWRVLACFGVAPQMIEMIRQFHDRMRACVRTDGRSMLRVVRGGAEAPSGMRSFPAAVQRLLRSDNPVALEKFSDDAYILADLVHLQEQPSKVGPKTALGNVPRTYWGILYTNEACIVSRSPRGLERMMAAFVEVFGILGLTISESRTETMCMPSPRAFTTQIVFNATGQQ